MNDTVILVPNAGMGKATEDLQLKLAARYFELLLANSGSDALRIIREERPDLIFMDIHMPNCDGVDATRLIKAEMPDTKIVMLTMSEDEQDLFEAVKSGASGYLLKKLKPEPFFALLADLQAGLLPFSPGLGARLLDEFTRLSTPASPAPYGEAEMKSQPENQLSPRQMQILTLVAQGQTYHQVAETLGISEPTVKYHMGEILDRLHLENRDQVIAYAAQHGFSRR